MDYETIGLQIILQIKLCVNDVFPKYFEGYLSFLSTQYYNMKLKQQYDLVVYCIITLCKVTFSRSLIWNSKQDKSTQQQRNHKQRKLQLSLDRYCSITTKGIPSPMVLTALIATLSPTSNVQHSINYQNGYFLYYPS